MNTAYIYLGAIAAGISVMACGTKESTISLNADRDWGAYLGDKASSQFSPLRQINRDNVSELEIAWTYNAGDVLDEQFAQIQTNPLIIDGVLYGASPAVTVFALDATNGKELWRFDASMEPYRDEADRVSKALGVRRGLVFWEDGNDRRLFFVAGSKLLSVDADTGEPKVEFGDDGKVDLREGLGRNVRNLTVGATTPGILFGDLLIQGTRVDEGPASAPGHIRAYDVRTGEIRWTFHTIPHPGEYGYDTWPPDAWKNIGGANNWSGMSLDEERGIVYVPTGSAAFDFWGGNRKGENLFANSLIALKAATGERLWHFQTVHHDIWDRDLPAPPNLVTLKRNGDEVDAVAQITKSGFVFVFDRVTGEPFFPIEERAVRSSDLFGEETWPTQPIPTKPKPFARQMFVAADVSDIDSETRAAAIDRLRTLTSAGQFIPFDEAGTIIFPGFDGGGEWGGAATDPDGVLYVNSNEMPWVASMTDLRTTPSVENIASLGQLTYEVNCAACHGLDRAGDPDQSYPSLIDIGQKLTRPQLQDAVDEGNGFMPSFRLLPPDQKEALIDFLLGANKGDIIGQAELKRFADQQRDLEIPYSFDGYHRFVDGRGNPVVKPPWGTLNAIDLNTGEYRWTVTLGEFEELTAEGIPPTGAENYGGPVVTAGGLLFIAATRDEMFRAFDKNTGEILWKTKLPAGGYATPATYQIKGKQYVVVAAGGGKMGTKSGDSYIAFALPD